jgi:hypothetical protein
VTEVLFIRLVYAKSQEIYQTTRDNFLHKLEDKGKLQFVEYFRSNWDKVNEKWVSYLRVDCIHLGNNTNNRLESAWGKIKLDLNRYTPLDDGK